MMGSTSSYLKVFYDLRPAKQIERRMIMDTLQRLGEGGFRIRDYQYTGFGSIYFVDFILLHRLLGLKRLLSVEHDNAIEKRVRFNRPFSCVEIGMGPSSSYLPKLDIDLKHIVWLDYDFRLQRAILEDVVLAANRLSAGSLLMVTVDVEPPDDHGPTSWYEYFSREAGDLLPFYATAESLAASELAHITAQTIFNAIRNGVTGRANINFFPLFNFEYADGHRMITVGGMIGTETEGRMIGGCNFEQADFLRTRTDDRPYEIAAPRLTRRERLYLDQHMPCDDQWTPEAFELSADDLAGYRRVYRFYPAYAELLL